MNISIGQNCLNKKPFEYIVPPRTSGLGTIRFFQSRYCTGLGEFEICFSWLIFFGSTVFLRYLEQHELFYFAIGLRKFNNNTSCSTRLAIGLRKFSKTSKRKSKFHLKLRKLRVESKFFAQNLDSTLSFHFFLHSIFCTKIELDRDLLCSTQSITQIFL